MAVETTERLLVTVEDGAQSLGVSVRKLQYMLAEGTIRAVHVGRSIRIPVAALRDYVERLNEQAPASR